MRGTDGRYVGLTSMSSGTICFVSPVKYAIGTPRSNETSWISSANECASGRYR
jgi:hypothetical protein